MHRLLSTYFYGAAGRCCGDRSAHVWHGMLCPDNGRDRGLADRGPLRAGGC